jgi:hypothetical protein
MNPLWYLISMWCPGPVCSYDIIDTFETRIECIERRNEIAWIPPESPDFKIKILCTMSGNKA